MGYKQLEICVYILRVTRWDIGYGVCGVKIVASNRVGIFKETKST